MRRRSKAGAEPTTARRRKTAAPKAVRSRSSSAAREEAKVARLNRERDEALQQQRATANVLKVISRSTFDLQVVFETLAESAAKLCKADFADIWRPNGSSYRVAASYQTTAAQKEYLATLPITPGRGSCVGRALLEAKIVHIPDIREDAEYALDLKKLGERRTTLGVPLLRDGKPIGVIALIRNTVRPFTSRQIELVTTFADQAVIAIENARLGTELRDSLEQQTAAAEVLRVISSSPADLKPVFETMLENAVRICDGKFVNLWLREGDVFRIGAIHSAPAEWSDFLRREPAFRVNPRFGLGRLTATNQSYQVADIAAEPTHQDKLRVATIELARARSLIGVPLLRDDEVIGAIVIYRQEVRPFTDQQIEVVENFAAQAVIAIENARLLNELYPLSPKVAGARRFDQIQVIRSGTW
jgi:two-component system NtrC family sensor kinase